MTSINQIVLPLADCYFGVKRDLESRLEWDFEDFKSDLK